MYKFPRIRENEYSISDFIIALVVVILMILGLVTLRSVVLDTKEAPRFQKQVIWDLLALSIMVYVIVEKEIRIKTLGRIAYVLSVILLVLVLLVGKTVYGARRWIDVGPFDLQPSELFKLSLVLMLSSTLNDPKNEGTLRGFLKSVLILSPAILVFLEPDLGMTILLFFIWFVMLLSSRMKLKYLLWTMGITIASAPLAFFTLLKDYQRARILAVLNPDKHLHSAAYNVLMSKAAIANGGVRGTGYGLGTITNMRVVPMQHTDFIFSAYAEQFGLLGTLFLLGLYGTILVLALAKLDRLKDNFWKYVTVGSCGVFAFHIFENVGMNIGLLPVTGIPLPFLSYGGTSTIIFAALVGLIIKARVVSKEPRQVE